MILFSTACSALPIQNIRFLKEALQAYPYFDARLDKTSKIQLTSLSAPQSDDGRTYRAFGLQLSFQEKERQLYE